MIKSINIRLEVLCVKKIRLTANSRALMCNIQRAPYLWTRCPTVRSATRLPIAPKLTIDPNSPLVSFKLAFTSGNRGTQDIINRPNRKKSPLIRLSSCLTPMLWLKIGHSLTLFGRQLNVDPMDQLMQKAPKDDSLFLFVHLHW